MEQLGGQTWGAGICKQGLQGPCRLWQGGRTKEARMEQGQGQSSAFAVLLLCLRQGLGKAARLSQGPHHLAEATELRAEERRECGQAASRSGWRSDSQ